MAQDKKQTVVSEMQGVLCLTIQLPTCKRHFSTNIIAIDLIPGYDRNCLGASVASAGAVTGLKLL